MRDEDACSGNKRGRDVTVKRMIGQGALAVAVVLLGLSGTLLPVRAADTTGVRAEQIVAPLLPEAAQWGLVIIDMATGRETLRAGGAEKPLVPGSLVKLVTAGALLDHAAARGGPQLGTTLSHDGTIREGVLRGNIYLTGRGNPLLSSADLARMAAALSDRGVGRVEGDLVVDAGFLDPAGVERKRSGAAYAEAGAVGLDLHTAALTVAPAGVGTPPSVTVEPANDEVRIAVEARTVALSSNTLKLSRLDDLAYRVSGNVAQGTAPVRMRFALREPALYAGGALATLLRQRGTALSGTVRKGKEPADAGLLAEIEAPDFDALLVSMNANSLNVLADNLLLVLGAETFAAPGTRDKGVRAVRGFLEKLGFDPSASTIADGSGLDASNRQSAGFLARYLYLASSQAWFQRLYATLPRAGGEGTLRDVGFTDQRFRAKTGTLEDAYGLAGYGVDRTGKPLAFAFIVNHPGAGVLDMKRAGAAVMRYLSTEVSL